MRVEAGRSSVNDRQFPAWCVHVPTQSIITARVCSRRALRLFILFDEICFLASDNAVSVVQNPRRACTVISLREIHRKDSRLVIYGYTLRLR